ncbi:hypothetical protein LY474_23690 [Myxococcus stipitatus]|uniref:hypothetical protein n=1 Tax=Myxococcus stipitatus TaxID=83455 RepID=UPI001F352298|nr:hypothetical protein [Myxococcus stipitatus]MCE9670814.1 hypothetical protein [Myxococcus stipitatus]
MSAARHGRGLAIALLALAGSGCPDESPGDCLPGALNQVPPRFFAVGERVSVTAFATVGSACGTAASADDGLPETVSVTLTDPNNLPVEATAELRVDRRSAVIQFTPERPGRHHAIVSFAPVGSIHQFDIIVAENGRDRAELARLKTGRDCLFLDRTTRGTWVCNDVALNPTTGAVQELGSDTTGAVEVAGDVVWALSAEGDVRRFVDDGGPELVLTGTAPLPQGAPLGSPTHARLATEDEYLVLDDQNLYRFTFDPDPGLVAAPGTPWTDTTATAGFGQDDTRVVALRAGATVWLVTSDLRSTLTSPFSRACPYDLGPTGGYEARSGQACYDLDGVPVAFEEDVLWTQKPLPMQGGDVISTLVQRYVVTQTEMVRQGVLPLDTRMSMPPVRLRQGPALPVVLGAGDPVAHATPRWNPSTQDVTFVLHPNSGVRGHTPRVSNHFVWVPAQDNPSELSVYTWPPPP